MIFNLLLKNVFQTAEWLQEFWKTSPCSGRAMQSWLPRITSRWLLNSLKEGNSTTSLGSPSQPVSHQKASTRHYLYFYRKAHIQEQKKTPLSSTLAFSKLNHRFVLLLHGVSCSIGTVCTSPLLLSFLTPGDNTLLLKSLQHSRAPSTAELQNKPRFV